MGKGTLNPYQPESGGVRPIKRTERVKTRGKRDNPSQDGGQKLARKSKLLMLKQIMSRKAGSKKK